MYLVHLRLSADKLLLRDLCVLCGEKHLMRNSRDAKLLFSSESGRLRTGCRRAMCPNGL